MKMEYSKRRWKVRPIRRLTQMFVLIFLIVIPATSQNFSVWSPSLIIQGYLPSPVLSRITGDTWSLGIGDFRITHPVALMDFLVSAKECCSSLFISVLIPLCVTLILGRAFCSWLCPVGFLLELNMKANRLLCRMGFTHKIELRDFRYIIFALLLILGFFFSFPLISTFDPPHVLGRELMYLFTHQQVSLSGMGLLIVILLFEVFFTSRAWCRAFCPSGGGLALLGRKRMWRIRIIAKECIRCEKCNSACPYGLSPSHLVTNGNFDWTICDNCGLCRDICPTKAISYGFGLRNR